MRECLQRRPPSWLTSCFCLPFLCQQASWNVLLWLADRFRRTGRERLTNSVRVLVQPLAQQEQLTQYAVEIRS
jgi:hypothetical protein